MVDQEALIHDSVVAIAREFPHKAAVICGATRLSYAELDRRSDRIADALAGHVRKPGQLVAVRMRRSVDQVAALLGVLKAGGAFLPIEPGVPAAWRAELLADSQAVAVLVDTAEDCGETGVPVVAVADALAGAGAGGAVRARAAAHDAAYVIYTSGSTGTPKGVVVEHRNVLRLFTACRPLVGFDAGSTWSVFHSFSFDFSVWELWGALLHGGTAVLIPDAVSDFAQVARIVADEQVTLLSMTPSNFSLFSRHCIDAGLALPQLRTVVFGGERLDQAHLRDWHARYADAAALVNMYGITETTVHATFRRITGQDIAGAAQLPIGAPLPDLSIFLVDAQGAPVPRGEPGEMAIAGPGVARGYLNREALTRERFPMLPLGPGGSPMRVYLSGDYASEENGELIYRGRRDDQVKVRGYRIELGQVEAQLMRLAGIGRCVVAKQAIDEADSRLIAFVVAGEGWRGAAAAKAALAEAMPAYMIPSQIVEVAAIPVTVNGKVDRQALLAALDEAEAKGGADGRNAAIATVAQLAREILKIPDLSVDEDLFDQGATSLSLVRLLLAVNARMGVTIVGSDLDGDSSVVNIARLAQPAPAAAPPAPAARTAATETVAQLARDILKIPDLSMEEDLFDQGATSLSLVRLLLAVNERFGAAIAGADLDGDASVANIARLALAGQAAGKPLALAS
jgi:amino acid adenylation domain-containing protein